MLRSLSLPALVLAAAALPAAELPDLRHNVGIGLGTLIFESVGSDGLLSQTAAATTNGTFGNQTFAVTTGTSGARKWTKIAGNSRASEFVRDNMDVLAREMSAGRGESIDALAEVIGVPAAERSGFAAKLQAGYADIFAGEAVTHDQVVSNIETVLSSS